MKQLLKFSASWCQPCKSLASNMKLVNLKDIELKEIDIDEDTQMAIKHNIRGVPTLVLLEDGVVIGRKSGVLMVNQIEEFIHG